jgi:hypothetical protein
MSSKDKEDQFKKIFESSFISVVLMLLLIAMGALFVVAIWRLFGQTSALQVLMYLGIGIGGGLILAIIIILAFQQMKAGKGRNVLLTTTVIVLMLSLVVAFIIRASLNDPIEARNWFINVSSIGLGITTGIAFTYSLLAIFKSSLVYEPEVEEKEEQKY